MAQLDSGNSSQETVRFLIGSGTNMKLLLVGEHCFRDLEFALFTANAITLNCGNSDGDIYLFSDEDPCYFEQLIFWLEFERLQIRDIDLVAKEEPISGWCRLYNLAIKFGIQTLADEVVERFKRYLLIKEESQLMALPAEKNYLCLNHQTEQGRCFNLVLIDHSIQQLFSLNNAQNLKAISVLMSENIGHSIAILQAWRDHIVEALPLLQSGCGVTNCALHSNLGYSDIDFTEDPSSLCTDSEVGMSLTEEDPITAEELEALRAVESSDTAE